MIVSLIIPPSPFLGDQKRNTPLGILYIASWLEMHGYEVCVTDLRETNPAEWNLYIPFGDVYGITATTPEYPYALQIANILKNDRTKAPIILGGVHVTATPQTVDPVFDILVMGEGEITMLQVLDDIQQNKAKRIYHCKHRIMHLDLIPFPARHLVSKDSIVSYTSTVKGEASTTIIGSRGCAYNCAFCASKVMWDRRVKFRSPNNIVAEIKFLIDKYDVYHFRFQDDTLGINKTWIIELCTKLKPLKVTWRGTTRVDHSSKEILQAMKDAGCYEIAYGIETLDDKVLEMNNKQITNEEIHKAISTAKSVGLKTRLFFMIGLPGQDINIAMDIINFIEECKPDAVNLSTFVPLPGSDIYNNPEKYGIVISTEDWNKYIMSKGLYGTEVDDPFIFTHDKLTDLQLRMLRKQLLEYFAQHNLVYNK